jgi:SCY1-like protein 1
LTSWLSEQRGSVEFEALTTWGLYSLTSALSFITQDAKCIHGNVTTDAVFVTRGGDWKLGNFELAGDGSGDTGDVPERLLIDADAVGAPLCPDFARAPERAARDWGLVNPAHRWALDIFSLGVVVWDVFAGDRSPLRTPADVRSAVAALSSKGGSTGAAAAIPATWRPLLVKMLADRATSRPPPSDVLSGCAAFRVPLVGALLFLDSLPLKEPKDKARFFSSLPTLLPRVPNAIALYKLLPALMQALEFGAAGGGGTVTLAPILEIGARLPPDEYSRDITPVVVKLFASLDRATRVQLLTHLPSYIDKLADDIINNSILPSIVAGFTDSAFPLREATVKSCLALAPRASPTSLKNFILANLKRTLSDAEPGIRVNATICLGRVAVHVEGTQQRESEVLGCFLREMRDSFPHARAAALRATTHCVALNGGSYWSADVVSKRVLAAAAHLVLDPFGEARAAAFALIDASLRVLREESERLEVAEKEREAAAAVAAARGESAVGASASAVAPAASSYGGGGVGTVVFSALGWAVGGFSSSAASAPVTGTMGGAPSVQPRPDAPDAASTAPAKITVRDRRDGGESGDSGGDGWGNDGGWDRDDASPPRKNLGGSRIASRVEPDAAPAVPAARAKKAGSAVPDDDGWGNLEVDPPESAAQTASAAPATARATMKLIGAAVKVKSSTAKDDGWADSW